MPTPRRPITPDDPRHGTLAGYNAEYKQLGGRSGTCAACREAERLYQNRLSKNRAYGRPIKVSSVGTCRRIQALMAIGWSGTYLCQRLGVLRGNLPVHDKYATVRIATANKVKALYEELIDHDGPAWRTRQRAEKQGFATPDRWVGRDIDDPAAVPATDEELAAYLDDVAVERTARALRLRLPEEIPLSKEEKIALIRRADELGVSHTSVQKHLKLSGSMFMDLVREAERESA